MKDWIVKGSLASAYIAGAIAAILAFSHAGDYVLLRAEADEQKRQIIALHLEDVRKQLLQLRLERIRTKNRTGLSSAEKEESLHLIDEEIRRLEKQEKCFEEGELECL